MDLYYLHPKPKKTKVVLLCDVSKSMELYSRFTIEMMFNLQNSNLTIETFVFSTSLYRITNKLKNHHLHKALDRVFDYVEEWSSGTRIGECLTDFVVNHGRKHLHGNPIVFIVSDGWDSGDTRQLDYAMRKIKRQADQVIWFNPLATSPAYAPESKGMRAALPHIDHLVPALEASDMKRFLSKY